MGDTLTRAGLHQILGPARAPGALKAELTDEIDCDGYERRLVAYDVPSGRASAFVCIPSGLARPAPVVFCHHQHAGQFDLGKSEVCGLRGNPDQAYAAELAQRWFVTIAPDAIGFEDRNGAAGQNLGCIPYRDSFAHDAGFQAELVVPDFASRYDVEDVLLAGATHVRVDVVPGRHEFLRAQRETAYALVHACR